MQVGGMGNFILCLEASLLLADIYLWSINDRLIFAKLSMDKATSRKCLVVVVVDFHLFVAFVERRRSGNHFVGSTILHLE
jgi:hypothetical protein